MKRVGASVHSGADVCQDLQAADGQDPWPDVPTRRRTTRATQRRNQRLEVQQGLEKVDLQSALENVGESLVNGTARRPNSEKGSTSSPMQQGQGPWSPSKNVSDSTRSSSLSKKSTRIDTDHLGFYEPRINFMSYAAAKDEGFLTESERTLWWGFIQPCVSGTPPIPCKLKAGIPHFRFAPAN
jgi:hypothetical protein